MAYRADPPRCPSASSRRPPRLLSCTLLAALLGVALVDVGAIRGAAAQEATDAAAAFAEGERAFAAGDFGRAAAAFDRAYASRPHESALWNAARSYERAGDDVRAANRYHAYLDAAPAGAPDRDRATSSLRDLAGRLGRLDLVTTGVSNPTVDGEPVTSSVIFVAPGKHRLEGKADVGPTPIVIAIEIGAGERRAVLLAPQPASTGATTAPSVAPSTTVAPAPTTPSSVAPVASPPVWPAIVLGGLTGVSLGLSIASGVDVLIAKGDFDDEVDRGAGPELQRTYIDQGVGKTTRTNVLYGVTGALAIATAITIVFTVDFGGGSAPATSRGGGHVGAAF